LRGRRYYQELSYSTAGLKKQPDGIIASEEIDGIPSSGVWVKTLGRSLFSSLLGGRRQERDLLEVPFLGIVDGGKRFSSIRDASHRVHWEKKKLLYVFGTAS